jgi:hypothetical protein
MKFFFQIYFMSQNIPLCQTYWINNKLQLKSQKVIVHAVVSDSKQSGVSLP